MKYKIVNKSNVDILYKLNKKLAKDENQSALFKANKRTYQKAFICKNPIVFALLIYKRNKVIGFIIYINKFATYLASKVLFMEDIYLKKRHQTNKNIDELFQYIINKSRIEKYSRIELRVLKNYSFNKTLLLTNRFKRITKWDTYRFE